MNATAFDWTGFEVRYFDVNGVRIRARVDADAPIDCDTLVLWGERGVIHRLFDPLALWQAQCAGPIVGEPMPAGHFIPEELPDATAAALKRFMHG